jgi:gliding motility-associated-like protein
MGDTVQHVFITNSSTVWVQSVDINGCLVMSDTMQVVVNPSPPVPVIVQSDSLLSTAFFAGYTYAWYFDGLKWPGADGATFVPDTNGVVTVTLSDPAGCTSQSITYLYVWNGDTIVLNGFIPSGFSPNGDGVNDVFYIPDAANGRELALTIVNRWGETVYTAEAYQNQWGGTSRNGEQLPSGNYYYTIEYSDGHQPRQGVVLINR